MPDFWHLWWHLVLKTAYYLHQTSHAKLNPNSTLRCINLWWRKPWFKANLGCHLLHTFQCSMLKCSWLSSIGPYWCKIKFKMSGIKTVFWHLTTMGTSSWSMNLEHWPKHVIIQNIKIQNKWQNRPGDKFEVKFIKKSLINLHDW